MKINDDYKLQDLVDKLGFSFDQVTGSYIYLMSASQCKISVKSWNKEVEIYCINNDDDVISKLYYMIKNDIIVLKKENN